MWDCPATITIAVRRMHRSEFNALLARLDDCDLNEYDRDFVDDMFRKFSDPMDRLHLTPRQQQYLETLRERYL